MSMVNVLPLTVVRYFIPMPSQSTDIYFSQSSKHKSWSGYDNRRQPAQIGPHLLIVGQIRVQCFQYVFGCQEVSATQKRGSQPRIAAKFEGQLAFAFVANGGDLKGCNIIDTQGDCIKHLVQNL